MFPSAAAWGGAVCLWCHQLQFFRGWHHVLGKELVPGQRHVPSLPACSELHAAQGQAQPGWELHEHGSPRGRRGRARRLRREGRGTGQHHWCAHSFLRPEKLHAAAVAFPSPQLGAGKECHQWSRNQSEEVSGELICFALHPLAQLSELWTQCDKTKNLRMSLLKIVFFFSLIGVKTFS